MEKNSYQSSNNESVEHPSAKILMTPRVYMLPSTANFGELISLMYDKQVSAIFIFDVKTRDYFIISHSDVVDFLFKSQNVKKSEDIYNTTL